MSTPTTSVVICCYTMRRWAEVQAAVESVLQQTLPADQLLLVVDHCTELEELAGRAFRGARVQVLANAEKQGLSGARNTGIAHSTGDVVLFLDDDAVAEPGWLAEHARHYHAADVMGVGGLVLAHWESEPPRWFPDEFGWVVGCSYEGLPTGTAEIRNPIGANMSFRRSVLEAVGGFAHTLGRVGVTPRGCEETELSIRAARAFPGSRILHEPRAVVRHLVPAHRARWAYFRRRCWSEGLSKADVSRLSDPRSALASERSYVTRTLASAVRRNLGQAGRQRELAPLGRSLSICAGLLITTAGYVRGRTAALSSAQPDQR